MVSSALPQLNIGDFQPQIFWLIVVFTIFYSVIKKKISPYFYSETENREQFIQGNHIQARNLQKKVDILADQYAEKLQDIHARANAIIVGVRQDINKNMNQQKEKITQELSIKLDQYYKELNQEFIVANSQLEQEVKQFQEMALEKIMAKKINSINDNHNAVEQSKLGGGVL